MLSGLRRLFFRLNINHHHDAHGDQSLSPDESNLVQSGQIVVVKDKVDDGLKDDDDTIIIDICCSKHGPPEDKQEGQEECAEAASDLIDADDAPVVLLPSYHALSGLSHPLALVPIREILGMLPASPVGPLLTASYCPQMPKRVVSSTRRLCLVLDLDETLVHSSFTPPPISMQHLRIPLSLPDGSSTTVFVRKRPGVQRFLWRVSRCFEVVIFTASLPSYADPVIDCLSQEASALNGHQDENFTEKMSHPDLQNDVNNDEVPMTSVLPHINDIDSKKESLKTKEHVIVHHRLYREACVQLAGLYIKDLSRLGRPVEQTLLVDNSPASFLLHPEQAIAIRSWFADNAPARQQVNGKSNRIQESPSITSPSSPMASSSPISQSSPEEQKESPADAEEEDEDRELERLGDALCDLIHKFDGDVAKWRRERMGAIPGHPVY